MNDPTALLHGPYHPPAAHVGAILSCLFRGCDVRVTAWTDARISWPRGVRLEERSPPSLIVTEELLRAIQHESAEAVKHWWGASVGVVWRWRKAFGVTRTSNPSTHALMQQNAQMGAAVMADREYTPEECEQRRQRAIEQDYGARLPHGYHGRRWTAEEIALLGTDDDHAVAEWIGRTADAVRIVRMRRGIPAFRGRRKRGS